MSGKKANKGNKKVDKTTLPEETKSEAVNIRIKATSSKLRRPYGLLASAGLSSSGLTPSEAWETWSEYRKIMKDEATAKKPAPVPPPKPEPPKPAKKAELKPATAAPKIKQPEKQELKPTVSNIKIPELNKDAIYLANSNSMYERGSVSEREYKSYADKILKMDISDAKKEKLIGELKKRWDNLLNYQAQWVPWTVSGPARYNAKKYDKGDQVMREHIDISKWFDGVTKNVENSKSQYKDDRKEKAKREEETFNRMLSRGWYSTPTSIANGLAPIAQYDPKRYVELYEEYDKKYKFRKNTNAAKLYEQSKSGKYTGIKQPEKLHETENLNTYKKTIQAGERVFMKFTTRPKPQLIYALKKKGWHWNANEEAWGIDAKKYDKDFVANIDEKYKKYL